MCVDVVTVPKFQQTVVKGMLGGWCGDGLGHYIICKIRAGMARAHTSLLYILKRLNGEGAWVVRSFIFPKQPALGGVMLSRQYRMVGMLIYMQGCNGVKLVLHLCEFSLVHSS